MGTDPNQIDMVTSCLEGSFTEVRCTEDSGTLETRFLFNDQQLRSGLIFTRRFIDDFRGDLKAYVEKTLLPKLKESPGKIIYIGSDGMRIRNMIQ